MHHGITCFRLNEMVQIYTVGKTDCMISRITVSLTTTSRQCWKRYPIEGIIVMTILRIHFEELQWKRNI